MTKKHFVKTVEELGERGKVRGWANEAIERLKQGETVQIRPRGNSMSGLIEDNELVTVKPISPNMELKVGDIVLVKVKGRVFLHLIKAKLGVNYYQIGNNRGGINGLATRKFIYGKAVNISEGITIRSLAS